MDSTTKMQVEQIIKQGWYRKSQTLGAGGWSKIPTWNTYVLYGSNSGDEIMNEIEIISAKDDNVALEAFKSLYYLDEFTFYDIYERITEFRLVDTSDKGE